MVLVGYPRFVTPGRTCRDLPIAPADTRAIQALNRGLRRDIRVDLSLLPLGDGLTICRKR